MPRAGRLPLVALTLIVFSYLASIARSWAVIPPSILFWIGFACTGMAGATVIFIGFARVNEHKKLQDAQDRVNELENKLAKVRHDIELLFNAIDPTGRHSYSATEANAVLAIARELRERTERLNTAMFNRTPIIYNVFTLEDGTPSEGEKGQALVRLWIELVGLAILTNRTNLPAAFIGIQASPITIAAAHDPEMRRMLLLGDNPPSWGSKLYNILDPATKATSP